MASMMKLLKTLKTGRPVFMLLSLILLLPIAAGTLRQAAADAAEDGDDSLYKHLSVFTEVLSLIQRSYVDETSLAQLFAGALEGATDALDPLATYVPAPDVPAYRKAMEIGSSRSGLHVGRDAGFSFVIAAEPGSPGAAAGIEIGDVIAKVGGRSTRKMPLWELQTLLAGESGSVQLELLRRGQTVEAELVLGSFEQPLPTVRTEEGIPVLRLSALSDREVGEVRVLLESAPASGSSRLVVDLRGIAGGSAEAAYELAGFFARGLLGELHGRDGVIESFTSDTEPLWTGRIAVLTNAGCQGACEVFVAAARQVAGAEVIGRRTFGHAGRRTSRTLSSGATLFFCDAFYAGPGGELLDQALEPNVSVQAERRTLSVDEDLPPDPVLWRALEILQSEEEQAA